jgi:hypothetical protein
MITENGVFSLAHRHMRAPTGPFLLTVAGKKLELRPVVHASRASPVPAFRTRPRRCFFQTQFKAFYESQIAHLKSSNEDCMVAKSEFKQIIHANPPPNMVEK